MEASESKKLMKGLDLRVLNNLGDLPDDRADSRKEIAGSLLLSSSPQHHLLEAVLWKILC